MNEENGEKDKPLIDPEVKDELEKNFPEDPMLTEYSSGGKGESSEKVDVTSEWIGEGSDWKTKTKLSAEQIIAMTQVRLLPEVFTELEELNPLLVEMVENIEKYAVSHGGMSREQQVSVLRAMHSGEMHDDSEQRSALLSALAMPVNDDE